MFLLGSGTPTIAKLKKTRKFFKAGNIDLKYEDIFWRVGWPKHGKYTWVPRDTV